MSFHIDRLRFFLKEKKITQTKIATLVGKTDAAISGWLSGKGTPIANFGESICFAKTRFFSKLEKALDFGENIWRLHLDFAKQNHSRLFHYFSFTFYWF